MSQYLKQDFDYLLQRRCMTWLGSVVFSVFSYSVRHIPVQLSAVHIIIWSISKHFTIKHIELMLKYIYYRADSPCL
jgi:hypothetical protein